METLTTPQHEQTVEPEFLHNAMRVVPFETSLQDEQSEEFLRHYGIKGEIAATLDMADQHFAIVHMSEEARLSNTTYQPVTHPEAIKVDTPKYFDFGDTDKPYVLFQVDRHGQLIGRAIRRGEPISIGRTAHEQDEKSARFDYQHDHELSRNHASIVMDPERGIVINDHSSNGTQIRAKRNRLIINGFDRNPKKLIDSSDIPGNNYQSALEAKPRHEHRVSKPARESLAAKELEGIQEFMPRHKVMAGDREFYISDIVKTKGRDHAILYTTIEKDGQPVVAARILYKSNSDGGWRVSYGFDKNRYLKETRRDSHYVQETKLDENILKALDNALLTNDFRGNAADRIHSVFSLGGVAHNEVDTGKHEVVYDDSVRNDPRMRSLHLTEAGHMSSITKEMQDEGFSSYTEYFRDLNKVFKKIPGFKPSFSSDSFLGATTRNHTLLGEINVEDYQASYEGRPIVWSMAFDKEGRVWVENIRFKDAKITSYGTYSPVFDAGVITNKPLEYPGQTNGLVEGSERKDFGGPHNYRDITPLLDNLQPIQDYRAARRITKTV